MKRFECVTTEHLMIVLLMGSIAQRVSCFALFFHGDKCTANCNHNNGFHPDFIKLFLIVPIVYVLLCVSVLLCPFIGKCKYTI